MRKTIITLVVALASLVPAGVLANGMPPEAGKSAGKGTAGAAATTKVTEADLVGGRLVLTSFSGEVQALDPATGQPAH